MFDDVICMDRYGNTVRSLAQWDLGQTLYIYDTNYPVAPMFQYSNTNTPEALTVQAQYVEGVLQCVVPNQLMVEPYPITCYIYIPEGEKNGTVVGMFKIPVRPRPKPSEFQYEDNVEIINIEILRDIVLAAVDDAEASKTAAAASATASAASATAAATSAQSASRNAAIATAGATLASESVADAAEQVDLATAQVALATEKALVSEGHALGTQNGQPVGSGSPYFHNNAKYWSDKAEAIASQTLGGLTDVNISNPQNGQALVYSATRNAWENGTASEIYVITITKPSSSYISDKLPSEIIAAQQRGASLVISTQTLISNHSEIIPLTDHYYSVTKNRWVFTTPLMNNKYYEFTLVEDDNDTWDVVYLNTVDLGNKADKVANATSGHLAALDSNGNLVDSGLGPDDVGKAFIASTTAPSNTKCFWIDTGNGNILKYYNTTSSSWVLIGSVWT